MPTYTEEVFTDQITVEPLTGTVLWRETTVVYRDGVELSRSYHRGSCEVDMPDPPHMPPEVKPHRTLVDTPAARANTEARRQKDREMLAPKNPK